MKMPEQQKGSNLEDKPVRLEWEALGGTKDGEGTPKNHEELSKEEGGKKVLENRYRISEGLLRDGMVFVQDLPNVKNGSGMENGDEKSARLKDLAEIVSN